MDSHTNDPTTRQPSGTGAAPAQDYLRSHSPDEIAEDARAKAGEVADTVRAKASEAGAQVADTVNDAMTSTGEQLSSVAQSVRERAPAGQIGQVASATADALDRGGRYLQDQDLAGVRSDLEAIIRRYPIPSLLVGAGVSFLLARSLRR
jgi:hypothetical protein